MASLNTASTSIPARPTHRPAVGPEAVGMWTGFSTTATAGGSPVVTSSELTPASDISTSSLLATETSGAESSFVLMMTSSASNTLFPAASSASSGNHPPTISESKLSSAMAASIWRSTAAAPEPESLSATSDRFSPAVLAGVIMICVVLMLAFAGILLCATPFPPIPFPTKPHLSYAHRAPCSYHPGKPPSPAPPNLTSTIAKHDADSAELSASSRNSLIYTQSILGNGSPPSAVGRAITLFTSVPWGAKQGGAVPGYAMSRNRGTVRCKEGLWGEESAWSRLSYGCGCFSGDRCPLDLGGYSSTYGERVTDDG